MQGHAPISGGFRMKPMTQRPTKEQPMIGWSLEMVLDADHELYRLTHRFCTTVICSRHKVYLWDSCPCCGSPISPFTLRRGTDWAMDEIQGACTECLNPGRQRKAKSDTSIVRLAPREMVGFQGVLELALTGQDITVPDLGRMSARKFLTGLRFANSAATFLVDRGMSPGDSSGDLLPGIPRPLFPPKKNQVLEHLPLEMRIKRIEWFAWIYSRPYDHWHRLINIPGMTSVLPKRSKTPWDLINENGVSLEGRSWVGRSEKVFQAHPTETVERFFRVADLLCVPYGAVAGLLGGEISYKKYLAWRNRPSMRIPAKSLHRVEHFIRIWEGLVSLFGDEKAAVAWMVNPNKLPAMNEVAPIYWLSQDPDGKRFEFATQMLGISGNAGFAGKGKFPEAFPPGRSMVFRRCDPQVDHPRLFPLEEGG